MLNGLRFTLCMFLILFASANKAAGATNVSGNITTDTPWTLAGSPYIVTGDIYVYGANSPTLTIEAGVTVKFNQYRMLYIGSGATPGALNAVGTATAPIIFTSSQATPTSGYWGGIYFSDGTVDANTVLDYVTVEYGGYSYNSNISLNSAAPTIKNSTIRKSSGYGINASYSSPFIQNNTITENGTSGVYGNNSSFTITGNTITNNGAYGIYDSTGSATLLSGSTFSGNGSYPIRMGINQTGVVNTYETNGNNAIEVVGGTVSQSLTVKNSGLPYVITRDIYVYGASAPTLTIEPGVTVKFNQYRKNRPSL